MYQETLPDLEKKWHGSYCFYGDDPIYVEGFQAESPSAPIEGIFVYKVHQLQGTGGRHIDQVDPALFAPINIPNGLYNIPLELQDRFDPRYRTACWRHSRNPRRSPMRGVTGNTHVWENPLERLYRAESSLRWSFHMLDAVMNPTYVNYHRAFEACRELKLVAIDRGWAVGLSPTTDTDGRHLFASMYGFCGWAYPDRIVIKHRGSYQEVLDFVRRSRLDVPVILDA